MNKGELTRICPECDEECENAGYETDNYGDPDYSVVTWIFECENCGCEFEVSIVTEEKDPEVTKHGKEYKGEE